jgi:hypothetical protein
LRSAPLLALFLGICACAHARSAPAVASSDTVEVAGAVFHLHYWHEDAEAAEQVKRALQRAAPAAERWGTFSRPVVVTIHPTHESLESVAGREGYAWLRAWARYGSIDLQSPRTWSRGSATDAELVQILSHELTHCVMYQGAASESTWPGRGIPLWFREGMASVTAGDRRAGPDVIQRFYRAQAAAGGRVAGDPLVEPGSLFQFESALVYATAHRAFHFLLDRYGDERVRGLIVGMGQGKAFPEAFRHAMGIPLGDFESDFKRYIVLEGWREGRPSFTMRGDGATGPEALADSRSPVAPN